MVDLETRELRYFMTLADELHFGRAAERLFIAQPALSKAIQRVEARLGVALLERSSRRVALTPAGRALQEHGRHALNAVDVAVRSAQSAGDGDGHLRLVLKPGGDAGVLSAALGEYSHASEARHVDIVFSGPLDRHEILRTGRADVGLLYLPLDPLDGLAHVALLVEGRVALLPADHRLANRASLRLDDLDGEPFPRWRGLPGDDGNGPELTDVLQLLQMVQVGRTIGVLPRSLVEVVPDGVVRVPVDDAPPSTLALAWRTDDRRPSVAAFVRAAQRAIELRQTVDAPRNPV